MAGAAVQRFCNRLSVRAAAIERCEAIVRRGTKMKSRDRSEGQAAVLADVRGATVTSEAGE